LFFFFSDLLGSLQAEGPLNEVFNWTHFPFYASQYMVKRGQASQYDDQDGDVAQTQSYFDTFLFAFPVLTLIIVFTYWEELMHIRHSRHDQHERVEKLLKEL
jgi:hypothetical protein